MPGFSQCQQHSNKHGDTYILATNQNPAKPLHSGFCVFFVLFFIFKLFFLFPVAMSRTWRSLCWHLSVGSYSTYPFQHILPACMETHPKHDAITVFVHLSSIWSNQPICIHLVWMTRTLAKAYKLLGARKFSNYFNLNLALRLACKL